MKKTYEEIINVLKENDKVFVEYHESANELLQDNIDKDVLDEKWFVWGSETKPSELDQPFIMIDVESSENLPIFTEDRKEDALHYLRDNHKDILRGK